MSNPLRSTLQNLASTFTAGILAAIRSASLEDILSESSAGSSGHSNHGGSFSAPVRRGPGRPRKDSTPAVASASTAPAPVRRGPGRPKGSVSKKTASSSGSRKSSGRLARRSPEQIARALDQVISLVKSNKRGLRAEQIREKLGMRKEEMPRVLKEGLSRKALKSKGQKRSTTYFIA